MKRLRTIKQIIKLIKEEDQESCVTTYMIKSLVQKHKVYKVNVGNKILYDIDEILKIIGLVWKLNA